MERDWGRKGRVRGKGVWKEGEGGGKGGRGNEEGDRMKIEGMGRRRSGNDTLIIPDFTTDYDLNQLVTMTNKVECHLHIDDELQQTYKL
jgi:hypothetical protein